MKLAKIVPVLLVLALVVTASGAVARTFLPNQDASGNGHDLTEVGDPQTGADSGVDRFEAGYAFDGDDHLTNPDGGLQHDGDLSVVFAVNMTAGASPAAVFSASDTGWLEVVSQGEEIRYCFAGGLSDVCATVTLPVWAQNEFLSGWATRDTSGVGTDLEIRVFASNGTLVGSDTVGSAQELGGSTDGDFTIGDRPEIDGGFVAWEGDIYEVRLWTSALPTGTLDDLADPTDSSNQFVAEGTEEGLWFLETFTEAGDPTRDNSLSVYTPDHVTTSDPVTIYVQPRNTTGTPLEPDGSVRVEVTRVAVPVSDPLVQFWNGSAWSVVPFQHTAEAAGGNGNATLFKVSTGPFPDEDNIKVTAWTSLPQPEEGGKVANVTGQEDFAVFKESVTVAGHTVSNIEPFSASQTSYLIVVLGALVFAAFHGWVVPAFAALAALAHPLFEVAGVAYPFDFSAFVLLYGVGIALHMGVARFSSMREGRGSFEGK